MTRTLEVVVSADGEIMVEARRFVGGSCVEATAELIRGLGMETSVTHKPEYHRQQRNSTRQQIGGGR